MKPRTGGPKNRSIMGPFVLRGFLNRADNRAPPGPQRTGRTCPDIQKGTETGRRNPDRPQFPEKEP
jgi:hypothetical protein